MKKIGTASTGSVIVEMTAQEFDAIQQLQVAESTPVTKVAADHEVATSAWPLIASVFFFGLPMGLLFSLIMWNWRLGMGIGLAYGVLFALLSGCFVVIQTRRMAARRPDLDGQQILFEGPATHLRGIEGVGGYLWLASGQLYFRSHGCNIQDHESSISLADVSGVEVTRILGVIPNGIRVRLLSGGHERFAICKSRVWIERVLAAQQSRKEA